MSNTITTTQQQRATIIRPGIMVSVHTSCIGGISYQRVDLDAEKAGITDCDFDDDGTPGKACTTCSQMWPAGQEELHAEDCPVGKRQVTRWETTKVVDDPAEYHRAETARNLARRAIRKVCAHTAFGFLCPTDREEQLNAAIAEARKLAADFNASAAHTQVHVYVMKGRVASDDREAVRAIADEVRGLMEDMQQGIQAMDPAAVRQAADKAREVGAMLGAGEQEQVAAAVEQARRAARTIVARVQKGGEEAAAVLQDIQRGAIERARIAFLDMDDAAPAPAGPAMPAFAVQRVAGLDLDGVVAANGTEG